MESNSPLPIRGRYLAQSSTTGHTPSCTFALPHSRQGRAEITLVPDSDDFIDDNKDSFAPDLVEVPCSPFVAQSTQLIVKSAGATQPTQIVDRPGLRKKYSEWITQPTQILSPKSTEPYRTQLTQTTTEASWRTQPTQVLERSQLTRHNVQRLTQPTQPLRRIPAEVESLRLSPPLDLVNSSFLQSSPTQSPRAIPHATQPTQILQPPKSTQPRFIVNRKSPSNSPAEFGGNESQGTRDCVEVPASSPFQPHRSPFFSSDKVSSPQRQAAAVVGRSKHKRFLPKPKSAELSDDESDSGNLKNFIVDDTSDEEDPDKPMDIRPSSFVRKSTIQTMRDHGSGHSQRGSQTFSPKLGKRKRPDIYLQDINSFKDIKTGSTRMLAKRVLQLSGGGFTAAQCLDALLSANHSVKYAAKLLEQEENSESSDEDVEIVGSRQVQKQGEDDEDILAKRPSRLEKQRGRLEMLIQKKQQRRGRVIFSGVSTDSRTSSPEERCSLFSLNSHPDFSSTICKPAHTARTSVTTVESETNSTTSNLKPARRLVRRLMQPKAVPRVIDLIPSPGSEPAVPISGSESEEELSSGHSEGYINFFDKMKASPQE